MKPDMSRVIFVILFLFFSFYVPFAMLCYDRSSHAPIQVAVSILCFFTVLSNLYVVRPILNYRLLRLRGQPGSTVFDLDHLKSLDHISLFFVFCPHPTWGEK